MPPQDGDVRQSHQSVDNLLDQIPTARNLRQIYRLANLPRYDELLAELGLDARGERELRELLVVAGYKTSLEELCDAPFRPKRHLGRFQPASFQAACDPRPGVSGLGKNYARPSDR